MSCPNAGQESARAPRGGHRPGPRTQAWLRARARLVPGVLQQSPPWIRDVFVHAWAPMQALAQQVKCLPPALWDYLLGCEGGFVAISSGDSRYVSGFAAIRHLAVRNVAFVSIVDLARDNERPLHVIGHLIDHHLGCRGDIGGPWFSDGGGANPRWQRAGARLPRLYALGYATDETARANVRDYFAQSLALYCRDRQRLNVADPQIDKWFRCTLWDTDFWSAERDNEAGG